MSAGGNIDIAFSGRLGRFELDAAFTAPGRGVTALFGPSGCGKTSILRAAAGLHRLDGHCRIGGQSWQDEGIFLPPHRRPVGYVFQEASLFPHLPVTKNLLYASRGRVPEPAPGVIGFDEVVELLAIGHLLDRSPTHLSGGERQRVAIGRALLSQPRALLMDEPLSALDATTRQEIFPFLERLHKTLDIPVLYVSHDMAEVERLADHIVLLHAGKVIASGPLETIQSDVSLPLALQRDAAVSLDAVAIGHDGDYGLIALEIEGGTMQVTGGALDAGTHVRLKIRATDVSLAAERPRSSSILNILPARIVERKALGHAGNEMIVVLRLGEAGDGARLLARITRRSWETLGLAEGGMIYAQIKSAALVFG